MQGNSANLQYAYLGSTLQVVHRRNARVRTGGGAYVVAAGSGAHAQTHGCRMERHHGVLEHQLTYQRSCHLRRRTADIVVINSDQTCAFLYQRSARVAGLRGAPTPVQKLRASRAWLCLLRAPCTCRRNLRARNPETDGVISQKLTFDSELSMENNHTLRSRNWTTKLYHLRVGTRATT